MINLLGEKEVLKTILLLGLCEDNSKVKDFANLKSRVQKLYCKMNPSRLNENFLQNKLLYVSDKEVLKNNIAVFNMESDLNDIENVLESYCGGEDNLKEIYKLYSLIIDKAGCIVPGFQNIFNLVMSSLFYAKSKAAGGGSTSAAIGILWCDHRDSWQEKDFIEFFVHELTHTLLFLDERRFGHYKNLADVEKTQNYAYSAILKKKRPLDKVIHSIVVATEIVLLRQSTLGHPQNPKLHPPSEQIIENTLLAIKDARTKSIFLTERTLGLLDLCEKKMENCYVY